ncbi:MAG: hypothetical protein R2712_26555 [Vicinamibacterales bacterium]
MPTCRSRAPRPRPHALDLTFVHPTRQQFSRQQPHAFRQFLQRRSSQQ